jgi:hypothetical protein
MRIFTSFTPLPNSLLKIFFANDLDECSLLRGVFHLKTGGVLPLPALYNFLTMC